MRIALLVTNALLFVFVLWLTATWYGANGHLPFLAWSMFLGTPLPFLLLVASLPLMPYKGKKQGWLVLQALAVGLLLAFAWLFHANELLSATLGAANLVLAVLLLSFNIKTILSSASASPSLKLAAYAPATIALVIALLIVRNEAVRPIEGAAYQQLLDTHNRNVAAGNAEAAEGTAQHIRELAVAAMVEKGYSAGYARDIARDTSVEYLVPLTKEWNLVRE